MHDTFDPNASALARSQAATHLRLRGHVLVGHYEECAPGEEWLVYDCCGD